MKNDSINKLLTFMKWENNTSNTDTVTNRSTRLMVVAYRTIVVSVYQVVVIITTIDSKCVSLIVVMLTIIDSNAYYYW